MADAQAITTDETLRTLERRVIEGDLAAAEQLEAARRRLETPLQTVERLLLPDMLRFQRSITQTRELATAVYRDVLHVARLPRGAAANLAPVVDSLFAASTAAMIERGRLAALKRAEELGQRATRVLGRVDLEEALARAEGTATQRTISVHELEEAIESARATGQGHAVADHDVANSYKYPVSYTAAAAYRAADGSVVVEICRRASTRHNVVIIVDPV